MLAVYDHGTSEDYNVKSLNLDIYMHRTRFSMKFDIEKDCIGVDWIAVSGLLKNAGAYYEPDVQKKAFVKNMVSKG